MREAVLAHTVDNIIHLNMQEALHHLHDTKILVQETKLVQTNKMTSNFVVIATCLGDQ